MSELSKVVLPTGTTYDLKDTTARDAIRVWYGMCNTAENTRVKEVLIVAPTTPAFSFTAGNILVVKFEHAMGTIDLSQYDWSLKVGNQTGIINTYQYDGNPGGTGKVNGLWSDGRVVTFVYIGSNRFVIVSTGQTQASTSIYGMTKLSDSITSAVSNLAATSKAVKDALDAAKTYTDNAIIGNATFQGVVNSSSAISSLTSYKKGQYWVVGTAGTYVGVACEIGDFIFCTSDRGSAFSNSDFKVVQANIDMSIFKALAYKDSASTSYTPAGTVSQPTFTGTAGSVSVSGTIANSVTLASQATTATGLADVTPAGTVSQPTFTGTAKYIKANTTTVNSITAVGTLPSCTLPVFSTSVSGETLTIGWSAGSFSAGTLPTKGSNTTVATGIAAATSATGAVDITPAGTVSQPTFTGTAKYVKATVGTASKSMTGTFTPSGTVSQPTFSGTSATITVQ